MNSIELAREIRQIEQSLLRADLSEKAELSKLYHEKLRALSEIMDIEKKAEPFMTAEEMLSKPAPIIETIPTGIKVIDENMGGLVKGAFVQLAAASFAGKTTTMVKILSNLAKYEPVVHFDFEMGEVKLHRMLRKYLKTKTQRVNYKIDNTHYKLDELIAKIKLGVKLDVQLFVIDSKMKIETGEKDQYKESSKISKELSKLTRDYNITIVLINQMSEESIKNGYPSLKGSGDQVYDSDIIFYLSRIPDKQATKESGMLAFDQTKRKLYCQKNRFGETFSGIIERTEVMPPVDEPNYQTTATEISLDMPEIPV